MLWLDRIPYSLLIAAAVLMLGAPSCPSRTRWRRRAWSKMAGRPAR